MPDDMTDWSDPDRVDPDSGDDMSDAQAAYAAVGLALLIAAVWLLYTGELLFGVILLIVLAVQTVLGAILLRGPVTQGQVADRWGGR